MIAKQLSVFIENRKGRLGEVLSVLKENGVNLPDGIFDANRLAEELCALKQKI